MQMSELEIRVRFEALEFALAAIAHAIRIDGQPMTALLTDGLENLLANIAEDCPPGMSLPVGTNGLIERLRKFTAMSEGG